MSLTRIKSWNAGDILTAADQNAEFNNILNNALTLISPLTADLAFGGFRLTGLSAGSVASPALQFTSDADTGIYSATADTVNVGTGGVLRLTVNSAGLTVANGLIVTGSTRLDANAILTNSGAATVSLPTATDTLVGRATTDTLTNKSVSLASNTVTGTLAQFNTAVSDADLASIAGAETLTNKTLTTPTIGDFTNAGHNHQGTAGGGQLSATSVFSAGTVPTARLGSGTADGTTFLRGDQTWATVDVLDRVTADTTVTNTTTETTVYSFSVPGNTLGSTKRLRLVLLGKAGLAAGSVTLTIRAKYGATTVSTLVNATNTTEGQPMRIEFLLSGDGATNAQLGQLQTMYCNAGVVVAAEFKLNRGTATEDSTAAKTLAVTAQYGGASATESFVMEHAVLEVR